MPMNPQTLTIKQASVFCSDLSSRGISGVEYIKRVDFSSASDVPLEEHKHPDNLLEFIYQQTGAQRHAVNGIMHMLRAGDILILRPGETHSSGGFPQEKRVCCWLGLNLPQNPDHFLGLIPEHARSMLFSLSNITKRQFHGSSRLERLLDELFEALVPADGSPVNIPAIVANIILVLTETTSCSQQEEAVLSDQWIGRVLAFINSRLPDRISTGAVAQHMSVARTHLCTRFKNETGFSLHDYILRKKIDLAKARMMRDPELTVTRLAFELNFSSSQHLSRTFKTYTGISPDNFRKSRGGAKISS